VTWTVKIRITVLSKELDSSAHILYSPDGWNFYSYHLSRE